MQNSLFGVDAFPDLVWLHWKDGNAQARCIFDRHYSRYVYKDGRKPKLFVGPGQKMVLMTPDQSALFVWRLFISADGQEGVNCSIFRNESEEAGSRLIIMAELEALKRWPDTQRFFTYVDPSKVRSSNPGYCFIKAGWRKCGVTKWRKLLIFEKVERLGEFPC
jgi:hypothetical protein